ncbi:hypothetical protein BH23ACT7_BH23ACT7_19220 [soil metagenome]
MCVVTRGVMWSVRLFMVIAAGDLASLLEEGFDGLME